jgi:NAD-dependent SIR2 family protein deacetylase
MFEREYFKENPLPLFKFIWGIIKMNPRPTNAHYFMKLLGRKNIISKIFTQNIDGLEKIARIKSKLVVNAHGTLRDFICKKC